MKRISKSLLLIILAAAVPFMIASGQEKKTEKKVKIITVSKDGTKTIIDTTFLGEHAPGSVTLKNGKVIYFDSPGTVTADITEDDGEGNIYITTTIDQKTDGEKKKEEKIIIMSGEGAEWTIAPSAEASKHVYAYVSDDDKGNKSEKHVIIKSTGSKDAVWEEKDGKTFHVTVNSDAGEENDMTKYVIAKDGVVITVESDDEAKAKEIIKTIEEKLDVKSKDAVKKETPETKTIK